jgi:GH24 family phage-related lysozyme (muramidase)
MNNNKVTQEQIAALLDNAEAQEFTFFNKDHNVCYRLQNGFTIIGRGACVDPANFDIEIGRKVAREDAENKLWQLEGYLLQNRLFTENKINI